MPTFKLMRYVGDSGDECEEVPALWFDAYALQERIMEGLPVKITIVEGQVHAEADWPGFIEAAHMNKLATEFAKNQDVFSATPELVDDDGFILEVPDGTQ